MILVALRGLLRKMFAVADSGKALAPEQDDALPPEPAASEWPFPAEQEILRILEESRPGHPDDMWLSRSMTFATVLWPAMELVAQQQGGAVSEALYRAMCTVPGMEEFVAEHAGAPEAAAAQRYLTRLPGYSLDGQREMAVRHHGYTEMQVTYWLDEIKAGRT